MSCGCRSLLQVGGGGASEEEDVSCGCGRPGAASPASFSAQACATPDGQRRRVRGSGVPGGAEEVGNPADVLHTLQTTKQWSCGTAEPDPEPGASYAVRRQAWRLGPTSSEGHGDLQRDQPLPAWGLPGGFPAEAAARLCQRATGVGGATELLAAWTPKLRAV